MQPSIGIQSIFHREFLSRSVSTLAPKTALFIPPAAPVSEAVHRMCIDNVGCLLVIEDQKLTGIITERDILLKAHRIGCDLRDVDVATFMTKKPSTIRASSGISRLLFDMSIGGFRHMPIEQKEPGSFGILSTSDFIDKIHSRLTKRILEPDSNIEFDRNSVDQFFASGVDVLPPEPPLAAGPTVSIHDCVERMIAAKKGAIAIINDSHRVIGIFTERDYLRKIVLKGIGAEAAQVSSYMSTQVQTLLPSATIAFAFQCLSEKGYRHLPLVDLNESLTGMVSVRTFINFLAKGILDNLNQAEHRL